MKNNSRILGLFLAIVTLMFCALPSCTSAGDPTAETTTRETETTIFSEATEALGCDHAFGDFTTDGKFTCTEKQIFTRLCTKCGVTEEDLRDYVKPGGNDNTVSLDGKKVMFIGNSLIYYGMCIIDGNQKGIDKGYFYQLCRANGENTTVYSYVWGGKTLNDIYQSYLSTADKSVFSDIDYVFMSEAGANNASLVSHIKSIMSLFPKKTKFLYLCHHYTYSSNHTNIINALPKLQELGVDIVNWGKLVSDVWNRRTKVPGGVLAYNKETFVKNNKGVKNGDGPFKAGADGDNNHPNPLSGYITALMAYSAVTGKTAVGQPYDFCNDKSLHRYFDFATFISQHYNGNATTNFDKVFGSEADMKGLQQLIDRYNIENGAYPDENDHVDIYGDHLFESTGEKVIDASQNTRAAARAKCRYCGYEMVTDIGEIGEGEGKNIMLIPFEKVQKSGFTSVKDYINAGKSHVAHQKDNGWGKIGYSSIMGMASVCDGERDCRQVVDGSVLYWRIKDLKAKITPDGVTANDGKYISLIGYRFVEKQTADSFVLFTDRITNSLGAFDIIGGVKTSSGIEWTVLWSGDANAVPYTEYGEGAKIVQGKFISVASFDYLQIGIKSASRNEVYISELELYNK